jgi:hypothetical protein
MNGECTKIKVWLNDLAGSEWTAKTDAQGERLKQAQNVNNSLSTLGDVICTLVTKTSHIPFRYLHFSSLFKFIFSLVTQF